LTDIPRRSRLDQNTPAELAIRGAMLAVEQAGGSPALTEAVTLLAQAKDAVADHVEGVERKPKALAGLPVSGYQPQSEAKVALVNEFKADEERLLRKVDALGLPTVLASIGDDIAKVPAYDQRWLNIARTHFQEGFMALNRAVFQPSRIALPEDDGEAN